MVLAALRGLLGAVHYADIVSEVRAMPAARLALAALATAISYTALAAYDAAALRYAGAQVRRGTVLLVARRQFDRRSKLFEQSFEWSWWLCVATVLAVTAWTLLFAYQDVEYGGELWWQFEFDARARCAR